MERLERIYALHRLLANARVPVSRSKIEQALDCSKATAKRVIDVMRLYLNAPIMYDRTRNGYMYTKGEHYELPGLWFKPDELLALLCAEQLLRDIHPGLLDPYLAPLRKRIEHILHIERLGYTEISQRVRVLRTSARQNDLACFPAITTALVNRKRVTLQYRARTSAETTERSVSPQRLVHYRENWYLDAWCHLREDLRSFALDCVVSVRNQAEAARDLPNAELDAHYGASYGIFAGSATQTAVLRFTPERARWVATEQWHPQQTGQFLADGSYELTFPYRDPRELTMDILKYGPDVEVVAPHELRRNVALRLKAAWQRYGSE